MEKHHRRKRAAGQLATDPARETVSGEPKVIEPSNAGNSFRAMTQGELERHAQEILAVFPPHHSAAVERIALSPIQCPQCGMLLITGYIKGLPLHACRCVMITHLMQGASIPRHAGDWSAHLIAQKSDLAREETEHERN